MDAGAGERTALGFPTPTGLRVSLGDVRIHVERSLDCKSVRKAICMDGCYGHAPQGGAP